MIRPYLVEEITVDVARVDSAALADLAEVLQEAADATGQQPLERDPAGRLLVDLARQIRDILLWRQVRSDLLEGDVGGLL